ncbi:type II secretion system F family protein [Corynebacterium halotolerans]|uniref:Type II secretion system protein GspF domain-containing protein n=1 Tax=Corynebacterium halotolerans YIM 70093 = DSM 44683 TaxID=1121362 RepID=M1P3V4_9CORY|nr:type II secretion system F family protein [Corynebacterium halotolerans]AGF71356.1 hypothetical protein A605_01710 [Corynebacterium halotolerans YIM 70093 = DSM 44683]
MTLTLLLLAATLLIPGPGLLTRLLPDAAGTGAPADPRTGPKNPRDGPPGCRRWRWPGTRASRPHRVDRLAVAADIDLFAACARAGLSTSAAAHAVAAAGTEPTAAERWRSVAALLAIGVPAGRAWAPMVDLPGLSELAGLARMSQRSGAAIADGCDRISAGLRADAADDATARAERAGVFIALPLALCFLPAFFTLGLAPVVIGLGTRLLAG